MPLYRDSIDSPLGAILIVSNDNAVCALDFEDCRPRMKRLLHARYGDVAPQEQADPHGVGERMAAYLDGDLGAVSTIPVDTGGTVFQRRVWKALRDIPPGTTATYGALAARLGNAKASRAVGLANSLNPVAILIPCHRVIGANGKLTGYAGGLQRKQWLLAHESQA